MKEAVLELMVIPNREEIYISFEGVQVEFSCTLDEFDARSLVAILQAALVEDKGPYRLQNVKCNMQEIDSPKLVEADKPPFQGKQHSMYPTKAKAFGIIKPNGGQ